MVSVMTSDDTAFPIHTLCYLWSHAAVEILYVSVHILCLTVYWHTNSTAACDRGKFQFPFMKIPVSLFVAV